MRSDFKGDLVIFDSFGYSAVKIEKASSRRTVTVDAEDFNKFLREMGWTDAEAMRKLGIGSHNTLAAYKQNGGPVWLGLACAAIKEGLPPWRSNLVPVYGFRVWSQQAGEHLLGRGFRTEESIKQIGGEIVRGSVIYVDPADIREGRFDMSDADRHYCEKLLRVAAANEMPADQVRDFVSETVHMHAVEGHGDRYKLLRLFTSRAAKTKTTIRILEAFQRYL